MTPDEFRRLVAEHGSAAEAAVANPDRHAEIRAAFMRDEYEGMDRSFASSGGEVFAAYMPKSPKWFDDKVDQLRQAAQHARREADADELRRLQLERLRHEPAADVPTAAAVKPPSPERVAPSQMTPTFTQATILKAIRLLEQHEKQSDIARLTKLTPQNVRRVRLMYEGGLLDVNERGKLWVDETVRRGPRGRVMLRYWGADGHSLDPKEQPPRPRKS